jgi:hypothetical protein
VSSLGSARKIETRALSGLEAGPSDSADLGARGLLVNTRISERPETRGGAPAGRSLPVESARPSSAGGAPAKKFQRAPYFGPPRCEPRYVKRCGRDQLYVWPRKNPSQMAYGPRWCGSWRHEGPCARHEAAVTFARIREAVSRSEYRRDGWLFIVLTLDRYGTYSGKPFESEKQAYSLLSSMSRNFIARVRRLCRRNRWTDPGSSWVSVVEAHRAGWPHMNLLIYSPELAAALEQTRLQKRRRGARDILRERKRDRPRLPRAKWALMRRKHRAQVQAAKRSSILLEGDLLKCAEKSGWGVESTAERVRRSGAVASYLVKLAGEADATTGELSKLSQAPVNADAHFRRLRSGKGFLPPRHKNKDFTGTIVRLETDPRRSAYAVVPLTQIKDPAIIAQLPHIYAHAEQHLEAKQRARERSRATGVPYADLAPSRFGRFRVEGANFMTVGDNETVQAGPDGPEIFAVDEQGYIQLRPAPPDVAQAFSERLAEQLELKGVPKKCCHHGR